MEKQETEARTKAKEIISGTFDRRSRTGEVEFLTAVIGLLMQKGKNEDETLLKEVSGFFERKMINFEFKSALDREFEAFEKENPNHFAARYYNLFKYAPDALEREIVFGVVCRLNEYILNEPNE